MAALDRSRQRRVGCVHVLRSGRRMSFREAMVESGKRIACWELGAVRDICRGSRESRPEGERCRWCEMSRSCRGTLGVGVRTARPLRVSGNGRNGNGRSPARSQPARSSLST
jgi:hypothetical protein